MLFLQFFTIFIIFPVNLQYATEQTMNTPLKTHTIALITGLLFGLGLGLSQMVDRNRVLGFLDVAGNWDATLLFVLGGAVGVTVLSFSFILRRSQPLFADKFQLPSSNHIDRRLLLGAAIFGIGWGTAGYCPGPAISALSLGDWNPVLFLAAMITGSLAYQYFTLTQENTR